MTSSMIIDLHISADEYLRHYRGQVKHVTCIARDGRRIRFASSLLQRFITHQGVHGSFAIRIDENNKLQSFEQIG